MTGSRVLALVLVFLSLGAVPLKAWAEEEDAVLVLLSSGERAEVDRGLAEVRTRLHLDRGVAAENRTPFEARQFGESITALRVRWVPLLMREGRNEVAAEVALLGVLAAGNPDVIDPLMRNRTRALLNAGLDAEALSSAKSFYNVCRMGSTPAAIALVSEALAAADPEDPGIAGRFRLEQLDGADPDYRPGEEGTMLSRVKVDAAPFEEALAAIVTQDFNGRLRRGNLLLLADRPQEARGEFEAALEAAHLGLGVAGRRQETAILLATEGMARSMRAADGTVGQANEYLRLDAGEAGGGL